MPYIKPPDNSMVYELERIEGLILAATSSEDPSLRAHAALCVCLGIWSCGGVTREQAMEVTKMAINHMLDDRSN